MRPPRRWPAAGRSSSHCDRHQAQRRAGLPQPRTRNSSGSGGSHPRGRWPTTPCSRRDRDRRRRPVRIRRTLPTPRRRVGPVKANSTTSRPANRRGRARSRSSVAPANRPAARGLVRVVRHGLGEGHLVELADLGRDVLECSSAGHSVRDVVGDRPPRWRRRAGRPSLIAGRSGPGCRPRRASSFPAVTVGRRRSIAHNSAMTSSVCARRRHGPVPGPTAPRRRRRGRPWRRGAPGPAAPASRDATTTVSMAPRTDDPMRRSGWTGAALRASPRRSATAGRPRIARRGRDGGLVGDVLVVHRHRHMRSRRPTRCAPCRRRRRGSWRPRAGSPVCAATPQPRYVRARPRSSPR